MFQAFINKLSYREEEMSVIKYVLFPGTLSAAFVYYHVIRLSYVAFLNLNWLPQTLFVSKRAKACIR